MSTAAEATSCDPLELSEQKLKLNKTFHSLSIPPAKRHKPAVPLKRKRSREAGLSGPVPCRFMGHGFRAGISLGS